MVVSTFKGRALEGSAEGRNAVLVPQSAQPNEVEDLELVTWQVIIGS